MIQVYEGNGVDPKEFRGEFGIRFLQKDRWVWLHAGTGKAPTYLHYTQFADQAWRGTLHEASVLAPRIHNTAYPCPDNGHVLWGEEGGNVVYYVCTDEQESIGGTRVFLVLSKDPALARVFSTPEAARATWKDLDVMGEELNGVKVWNA